MNNNNEEENVSNLEFEHKNIISILKKKWVTYFIIIIIVVILVGIILINFLNKKDITNNEMSEVIEDEIKQSEFFNTQTEEEQSHIGRVFNIIKDIDIKDFIKINIPSEFTAKNKDTKFKMNYKLTDEKNEIISVECFVADKIHFFAGENDISEYSDFEKYDIPTKKFGDNTWYELIEKSSLNLYRFYYITKVNDYYFIMNYIIYDSNKENATRYIEKISNTIEIVSTKEKETAGIKKYIKYSLPNEYIITKENEKSLISKNDNNSIIEFIIYDEHNQIEEEIQKIITKYNLEDNRYTIKINETDWNILGYEYEGEIYYYNVAKINDKSILYYVKISKQEEDKEKINEDYKNVFSSIKPVNIQETNKIENVEQDN